MDYNQGIKVKVKVIRPEAWIKENLPVQSRNIKEYNQTDRGVTWSHQNWRRGETREAATQKGTTGRQEDYNQGNPPRYIYTCREGWISIDVIS